YPREERDEITKLDINSKELKGFLYLKGFTNLKELDCSNNQLTNLVLLDCPNLETLICNNNKITTNLDFLKSVNELEKLNISNCPTEGSLKPLQNLNKLEVLDISNTNLSEGLEYLPESCEYLICNSDYQHKSIELTKELDKMAVGGGVVAGTVNLPVGIAMVAAPLLADGTTTWIKENLYDAQEKNVAVKELSAKTEKFLSIYDEDKNKEISIDELIKERDKLAQDLNLSEEKSKTWGIVNAIKKLETEIIKYRKPSYGIGEGEVKTDEGETGKIEQLELENQTLEILKLQKRIEEMEESLKYYNDTETTQKLQVELTDLKIKLA
ncbi:21235_t:CDS:2, partial [Racocetra persica]